MQHVAVQGYIENGAFVPSEPIKRLPMRTRAILTILEDDKTHLEKINSVDSMMSAKLPDDIIQAQYDILEEEDW